VDEAGPPSDGQFFSAQMIWQEDADSVVVGTEKLSSLLKDEEHSGLNWNVIDQVRVIPVYLGCMLIDNANNFSIVITRDLCCGQIRAGNYTHFNFYEINNACNGGPELFSELQTL